METIDISWGNLFLGYLMLGIPLWAFWYYHTGLVHDTLVAAARMTVQLFLMGLYLTVLFDLNNAWINLLWLIIMIGVGTGATIRRSELHWRKFLVPVAVGSLISIVIVDAFFWALFCALTICLTRVILLPSAG